MKTCIIEGCEREADAARGWCWKHYGRWRKYGTTTLPTRPTPGECGIEGCDRPARHATAALCKGHYSRWKKDGPDMDASPIRDFLNVRSLEDLLAWCEERPCPRPELAGPCMVWVKGKAGAGYGRVQYRGVANYTHRLAYELVHGALLPGVQVNHRCDVKACCNPNHLKAGTAHENVMDRDRRGRGRWPGRKRSVAS